MNHTIKIIGWMVTILVSVYGYAQTPINLEEAYQKALMHNPNLKSSALKAKYKEAMQSSYKEIDPLNISAEYGQINSAYTDNRLSMVQTFKLPTVYTRQKQWLNEEWKASTIAYDIQKWELKRELAFWLNQIQYLNEKETLIKEMNQLYERYLNRANLRLKYGESNILEKSSAETWKFQSDNQYYSVVKDRELAEKILSLIINDGQHYTSEKNAFIPLQSIDKNSLSVENIYTLQTLNQQRKIEAARLKVEQAKLLPSISLGYNTATIQGMGADDKIYDANKRFHSVVVGVSIPIFNAAQRSVIRSQKINQQIADQQYQSSVIDLQKKITEYQKKYEKYKYEVNYYQTSGLNNATTLIETAQLQLEQGQINYLEWSMLIQQALEIKNQYLEAIKNLNEQTIELNALYQQL